MARVKRERGVDGEDYHYAAVVMEEIMEACMKTKIWILFCKHLIKSESSQSTIVISLVLLLMPIELNRSGK